MKKKLNGIEGWLVLFLIIAMLGIVANLVVLFSTLAEIVSISMSFTLLVFVIGIGPVVLWCYCIYCFIRLKGNAVFLVKSGLIISLAAMVLMVFIIGFHSEEQAQKLLSEKSKEFVMSIIWLFYFGISKRVKETFPEKKRHHSWQDISLVAWSVLSNLMWAGFAIIGMNA